MTLCSRVFALSLQRLPPRSRYVFHPALFPVTPALELLDSVKLNVQHAALEVKRRTRQLTKTVIL